MLTESLGKLKTYPPTQAFRNKKPQCRNRLLKEFLPLLWSRSSWLQNRTTLMWSGSGYYGGRGLPHEKAVSCLHTYQQKGGPSALIALKPAELLGTGTYVEAATEKNKSPTPSMTLLFRKKQVQQSIASTPFPPSKSYPSVFDWFRLNDIQNLSCKRVNKNFTF